MIDWLRREHGLALMRNHRIGVSRGTTVAVDGVSFDPPILCEAYGRLGRVAGTTLAKACQDAFKMVWLREAHLPDARLILLIGNEELEKRLTHGKGWRVAMLRYHGVEVIRAELTDDQLAVIHEAEKRCTQGHDPGPRR